MPFHCALLIVGFIEWTLHWRFNGRYSHNLHKASWGCRKIVHIKHNKSLCKCHSTLASYSKDDLH